MVIICVSDVAKWLNKARFYDTVVCFEDFCYWIDKTFKKTYRSKYVDTSNLTINDNLSEIFKDPVELKQAQSLLSMKHGIETEKLFVPEDARQQVPYKLRLSDDITLSGKIDYIKDNIIYEVKSRKDRLFKQLYEYEKVQIQLYMHMSGIHQARLAENCKGEENIIDIEYDPEYCHELLQQLLDYYASVCMFLNNPEDYYKCSNKVEFIRNLRGF